MSHRMRVTSDMQPSVAGSSWAVSGFRGNDPARVLTNPHEHLGSSSRRFFFEFGHVPIRPSVPLIPSHRTPPFATRSKPFRSPSRIHRSTHHSSENANKGL